jgi:hypothetical protein
MQKLITGLAAAAALALMASAGQACSFHEMHVMASVDKVDEGVSMSTHDGATLPTIVDEAAETAATAECPDGAVDCVPADK